MAPPIRIDPPDLSASPLYLLAVLISARQSRYRVLERITRRRLESIGVEIRFGDDLPAPATARRKRTRKRKESTAPTGD